MGVWSHAQYKQATGTRNKRSAVMETRHTSAIHFSSHYKPDTVLQHLLSTNITIKHSTESVSLFTMYRTTEQVRKSLWANQPWGWLSDNPSSLRRKEWSKANGPLKWTLRGPLAWGRSSDTSWQTKACEGIRDTAVSSVSIDYALLHSSDFWEIIRRCKLTTLLLLLVVVVLLHMLLHR